MPTQPVDSSDDDSSSIDGPDFVALCVPGRKVHVPASIFSDDSCPPAGYWVEKVCRTPHGGDLDAGIKIPGEAVFTWPAEEVVGWLV